MKNDITAKLINAGLDYHYLVPAEGWEPKKHRNFVKGLKKHIAELKNIIQVLEKKNNPTQDSYLTIANVFLRNYLALQKKYYS